jgi:hypothetical protein
MYEPKHKPLISKKAFHHRMLWHVMVLLGFTAISLAVGVLGFHALEGYSWIDSLLNAAMLLGGMGQISLIVTNGGKVFASVYAIYSGLWVIACTGFILAPVIHRILHHFHADESGETR